MHWVSSLRLCAYVCYVVVTWKSTANEDQQIGAVTEGVAAHIMLQLL